MKYLRLLPLPLALGISWIAIFSVRTPYFGGTHADPAYAYLLNALNLLNGFAPGHIDHPGTPVQTIGAICLFIQHSIDCALNASCEPITTAVLHTPELYLRGFNFGLIALLFTSFALLSLKIFRIAGATTALIFQLSLFAFFQIPFSLVNVSPEPLLIVATFITLYVLAPIIYGAGILPTRGHAIFLGISLGFGVATKLTFFPICISLFLLEDKKLRLQCLISILGSFALFTIPIWSQYGRFFGWIHNLATHDGRYGAGSKGAPPIHQLVENGFGLLQAEPFLVFSLFFALFAFLMNKKRGERAFFFLIGTLIICAQFFLTIKHPAPHYMLPSFIFSAAVISSAHSSFRPLQSRLPLIVFFISLLIGVSLTVKKWGYWYREEKLSQSNLVSIQGKISDSPCDIVSYYRSSLPAYALDFGNGFASNRYSDRLSEIYPRSVFYNIWDHSFHTFRGGIPWEALRNNMKTKCYIMYGTPITGEYRSFTQGLKLEEIEVVGNEGLYRLQDL